MSTRLSDLTSKHVFICYLLMSQQCRSADLVLELLQIIANYQLKLETFVPFHLSHLFDPSVERLVGFWSKGMKQCRMQWC